MYTRCTECRTVFHITVAELRAADGRVVCGHCDTEFDALDHLSDTLPPAETEDADDRKPAAEEDDESDDPAGARDEDEFLRELESLIDQGGEPGPEADDGDVPDPDSVFRVDDGDVMPADIVIAAGPDEEDAASDGDAAGEPADRAGAPADEAPADETPADEAPADEAPADKQDTGDTGAGGEPPAPLPLPEESPQRARWPRRLVIAVVLAVVAATWAHSERGRLLRHPAGQAVLGPVYSLLGVPAAPDWSPGDLKILRSATVADPDAPGSLRVTTEFRNAASFGQPYPVLRVTLEDRWGQQVGSRDFTPSEYRDGHVAGRLMRPGERVQATVSLSDPGARADGFRVDLCLEGPDRRLACAGESAP